MTSAQLKRSNLAVIFADCDGFKLINDSLGHKTGDQLLKEVARRFQSHLKDSDTISRMGGDEFTILLPDVQQEEATQIAQRLVNVFEEPFDIEGHSLFLTVSIGISLYPANGDNAETLIKNADLAMYAAKKQGKNMYKFYEPSMSHRNFNLLTLENELRHAIDNQAFSLYYQPQYDLTTGAISGMEALIRWNHDDLGMVSPAEFIPIAEQSGLIMPIGEWVLRTACLQNRLWQEKGYKPIRISVNFTAKQFQQPNLLRKIKDILDETRLDPQYLELEITEIAALGDQEKMATLFNELKTMGIKVDIDDFGTGFCSFSYLKTFPIDKLKIDKSFIINIHKDKENQAITEAIIRMGTGLGLKVIAEGIETEEELDFLKQLNCDEGQGYYFSRPLPSDDLERLLSNHSLQ